MVNYFLIANATQYMNALEAREQLNIHGKNVLIIVSETDILRNQIHSILNESDWNIVHYFTLNTHNTNYSTLQRLLDTRHLNKDLTHILKKEKGRLIVGNYEYELFYSIITKGFYHDLIVLDDGSNTINIASRRNEEILKTYIKPKSLRHFLRYILRYNNILYLRKPARGLTHFTLYQFEPASGDKIIYNTYECYNKKTASLQLNQNLVYFIGSIIVDYHILSKEIFLQKMTEIKDYFASHNMHIVYIPHRIEKKEVLDELEKIMPVKIFDLPLEIALHKEKELPMVIASFFSSVLFTINSLYKKIELISFEIEEYEMQNRKRETSEVYDKIKKSNTIKLVKLQS